MKASRPSGTKARSDKARQRLPAPAVPVPHRLPAHTLGSIAGNQARSAFGTGSRLPSPLQREFERAYGAPLDDVRLHTDERAAHAAAGESAKAFTLGSDIVFSEGRFAPETHDGGVLLAHELAHVLQQRQPGHPSIAGPAELEASSASIRVAAGKPVIVRKAAPVGIQRAPEDDEERRKPAVRKKRSKTTSGATNKVGTRRAPEPEIVGEMGGVPIKRYPPGKPPRAQKTYVKPSGTETLPEGTHQVTKGPPGAHKVKTQFESGNWAHKNLEQLESIIKPAPESLTSEKLPRGLKREVEVPDTRLPGARPRMDRVDEQNGVIYEIKPKGLQRQGQAEADGYASLMNRFSRRTDGKKWVGRCVTYDDAKVIAFLRKKGYLEPPSSAERGGAKKVRKRRPPPQPGASPPKVRKGTPPKSAAANTATVAPSPKTAPAVAPKTARTTGKPPIPKRMPKGVGGGRLGSAAAGIVGLILHFFLEKKRAEAEAIRIQKEVEARADEIAAKIDAQRTAIEKMKASNPGKPVYANVFVTLETMTAIDPDPYGPGEMVAPTSVGEINVEISLQDVSELRWDRREWYFLNQAWSDYEFFIYSVEH